MEGTEVEISRKGDVVQLTPVSRKKPDWRAVFAELDRLGPLDGFLEDRYEGLRPPTVDDVE